MNGTASDQGLAWAIVAADRAARERRLGPLPHVIAALGAEGPTQGHAVGMLLAVEREPGEGRCLLVARAGDQPAPGGPRLGLVGAEPALRHQAAAQPEQQGQGGCGEEAEQAQATCPGSLAVGVSQQAETGAEPGRGWEAAEAHS